MPDGWPADSHRERRRLFFRFARIFGVIVLLVLGGMTALAFLLTRLGGPTALLVWVGGLTLAVALPLIALRVAVRAFRHIAIPLADVMAAAEAVAQGDLSVRLPIYGPGDFGQLAQSFNHMAEELQRADRQRRNLTADVAHELRTPLHIIQGDLEGILDGVYEPTPGHIEATLAETRVLARLVEDLRTLSLAEAGQLPLERTAVDVAELLNDVATTFSGQAETAGIALCVETGDLPPATNLNGDAGRLEQVLGNLLANALRHTPDGGSVTLRAELWREGDGAGQPHGGVRITVSDTGEGIPAADLPYIFDRFWRGDPARSHVRGAGSGLGLAIARQLVQAHNGHISVTSEVGRGTTFAIDLPAMPGDPG